MKSIPVVSVVIPVYNVEAYLKECVESVLKQTFIDYEIILVDDGSTDRSGIMCDDYSKRDKRITVIHQKNGGLSAARNTGLKASKGKYVYFLDSDDYIIESALEELTKTAEQENADIVFFDGFVFFTDCEEDPDVYRYERKREYKTGYGRDTMLEQLKTEEYRTAVQFMLLKRDYLLTNHLLFFPGILHEDELFTFQVYDANGIVAQCHKQLYARRIRPGSIMTASGFERRYESMLKIYYTLADKYISEKKSGIAAKTYLIRISKSVIGKYMSLSSELQISHKEEFRKFQRDVMKHHGFEDRKLKIKCSSGVRNFYYRGINKLIR